MLAIECPVTLHVHMLRRIDRSYRDNNRIPSPQKYRECDEKYDKKRKPKESGYAYQSDRASTSDEGVRQKSPKDDTHRYEKCENK